MKIKNGEYGIVDKKDSLLQKELESLGSVRRLGKGGIIYHQGDRAHSFYYIKKGRARVYMTSPDGAEKTLSTAAHGDILGEAAFFDKAPRISSAAALSVCEVAVIDENTLLSLIQEKPQTALELLSLLAQRIRQLSAQLDAMTFMRADERTARLLLQSYSGKPVKLTHEEIAETIGATRVTVSKILNRFSREGLLKTGYGQIVILDVDGLSKIAGAQL